MEDFKSDFKRQVESHTRIEDLAYKVLFDWRSIESGRMR